MLFLQLLNQLLVLFWILWKRGDTDDVEFRARAAISEVKEEIL